MEATDNTPVMSRDKDFSSWGNPSEPPYTTPADKHNTLKQLRISPVDQQVLKNKRRDPKHTRPAIYKDGRVKLRHMQQHQRAMLSNVSNHCVACSIPQRSINAALILVEQYYYTNPVVKQYSRNDKNTSILPSMFLFKNVTTVKDNQERDNQYSDMFGWHKNPNDSRRPDIRQSSTAWMTLMYKIGSVLLQACTVEKPPHHTEGDSYFMTFNPYARSGDGEIYRTTREIGHYWSQMTSVHEYAIVFERLNESAHCNSALDNMLYIDTIIHSVCFDFAAWASQFLGHYRKTSTRENEKLLRQELIKEIHSTDVSCFKAHGIKSMFLYIARLVRPVRDDIKRTLSSHLTKIVDDIFLSREYNSQRHPYYESNQPRRSSLINVDYYPEHSDDDSDLENNLKSTSPMTHTSSNQDIHQDNDMDNPDNAHCDASDNDRNYQQLSLSSSYIETPVYQSPNSDKTFHHHVEYEIWMEENRRWRHTKENNFHNDSDTDESSVRVTPLYEEQATSNIPNELIDSETLEEQQKSNELKLQWSGTAATIHKRKIETDDDTSTDEHRSKVMKGLPDDPDADHAPDNDNDHTDDDQTPGPM